MPNLGESKEQQLAISMVKLLLLGDSKAGKTDWAMRAAEAGFNVLYLDGDVAVQTLLDRKRGLRQAALERVSYLDIRDYATASGAYVPFMMDFFIEFTTQGVVTWNDTKGRVFDKRDYEVLTRPVDHAPPNETPAPETPAIVGGDVVWQIRPSQLGPNDVLILDSWTTLISSLQQAKAESLGIDILEVEKLERDMYTGTAHKATQFLTLLRALRCHVIVIGHPREYQKKSPPAGSKGVVPEKDMKLDWVKMVPASTSNPHALTMGKNFSDIGWIDITPSRTRTIDFRPSLDRICGGHLGEKVDADSFSFANLVTAVGGQLPDGTGTDAWLKRFGPGEFLPAGNKATPAPLIGSNATSATPVKGLAGLLNKNRK